MKYEPSAVTQIAGCISEIFAACVFIKIISVLHNTFKVYAKALDIESSIFPLLTGYAVIALKKAYLMFI